MAIGTPVNTVAGAVVGSGTTMNVSIPTVTAGNILLFTSYGRRASSTFAPDDPVLTDTSAVPLIWTRVFNPQPLQVGVNPGIKGNWWWTVADGAAKTLTISWPLAGATGGIYTSVASFTIGAGKVPDFTNQIWGGATAGPVSTTLPVTPTTGLNFLSYYGGGGSTVTVAAGYTSLTTVGSSPYRTAYDLTPVAAASMGTSGNPDPILLCANIVEGAPAAGGSVVKVWTGSAWVEKPTKVWDGSAWVTKPLKVWNGSAWV